MQGRVFKIAANVHQHTKTNEDEGVQHILNKCSYSIEKQFNEDWNTHIHLNNNGPSTKVPLIFWFLIMIFNLSLYHQLSVKWVCVQIGNSSGHIGQTQS